MKRGIVCLLLLGSFFCLPQVKSQDFFEGTIKFKVEAKGPMAKMLKENEFNDELTMHMREGDYIVLLGGGRYPKTFLFIADSNYEYSIDMSKKMAYKFSPHADKARESARQAVKTPSMAKPTGKQQEVNQIMCDEYVMKKKDVIFYYYVHDDYRINRALFPKRTRAKASFLAQGLEGRIPLKTIKRQKDLMVITTATLIKPATFDKALFEIPPGFKVKGRDYRW
ncbi:MAG: hypothetical protein AAFR61_00820 [Bacteroidota bacterium]